MSKLISNLLFKVSNFLAGDLVLHFGKECFCACLWMVTVLFIRTISIWFYLDKYIPIGLIFASPMVIAMIKKRVPMFNMTALLPVRIAEGILGRVNIAKLGVSIPAHFAGCLLGIVLFRNSVPCVPFQALLPVAYTTSFHTDAIPGLPLNAGFVTTALQSLLFPLFILFDPRNKTALGDLVGEVVVVMLYTLGNLVLPQILYVNKLPNQLLSVLLLPVMLWRVGGACSTFHPVAMYCLWYLASPESTVLSPAATLLKSLNGSATAATAASLLTDEQATAAAAAMMAATSASTAAESATTAVNILGESFDLTAMTSMENLTELGQSTLTSINSIISDVNSSIAGGSLLTDMMQSITSANCTSNYIVPSLQPLHLLCPLIGGLLAGLICLKFCPDDPAHWKPHSSIALVSGCSNCRTPENPLNVRGNVVGTPIVCR